MKFLLVSLAIIAAASAQHNLQQTAEPIPILRQNSDSSPDGTFEYAFETANGINVDVVGSQGQSNGEDGPPTIVRGRYSYPSEDGTIHELTYTADETGFHPQADYLPTPPPTPEAILRALEYIQSHPQPEQQ